MFGIFYFEQLLIFRTEVDDFFSYIGRNDGKQYENKTQIIRESVPTVIAAVSLMQRWPEIMCGLVSQWIEN